ncbi:formylglycine-generating enzyme family protein [candidate division KSB1 bacterium]|nr:formylglycine-generating enzyme family protein [candidate division KSB1 bacterium]
MKRDLNWWREVFLLAAGSAKGTPRYITDLIDKILFDKVSDKTISPEKMFLAILAGQALYETEFIKQVENEKKSEPGRYTAVFERIRDWLLYGLTADKIIQPITRAEAGNKLAQIGDPRLEVTTLDNMQFCYVPAGTFWMGSPEDDKEAWDYERPQHQVEILYPYWISRFPITNAQFDFFVKADDGYSNKDWWTKDGLDWRKDRKVPAKYGGVYDLPNHPVFVVCWYEALAFTRWLTYYFQSRKMIPANWHFQLPSEAEWEKAARGGEKIPKDVLIQSRNPKQLTPGVKLIDQTEIRRYPWGREPDINRMNYKETGIGSSSTAGCFPGGRSVYGCEEMSGNVWEWTRSLFGKIIEKEEKGEKQYEVMNDFPYPYRAEDGREDLDAAVDMERVIRGGAFDNRERFVRCFVRLRFKPNIRIIAVGFRVVLSLFTADR